MASKAKKEVRVVERCSLGSPVKVSKGVIVVETQEVASLPKIDNHQLGLGGVVLVEQVLGLQVCR